MSITHARLNKVRGDIHFLKQTSPGLKPNFSQMARETGVSRQTIAKLWKEDGSEPKPRQKKPSQFDPYYSEIRSKFEQSAATIKAIFKYFQMKYPDSVFKSYDSFKSYVKANHLTEVRQTNLKAHVRFETEPGHQLQVDWKENISFQFKSGETIRFNIFTAVYGYSRYVELVYSPGKTTVDFLRSVIEVLTRAGGKPQEIYTDNMSAVVNVTKNKKTKHAVIRAFEKDTGIRIRLAKARSPQSKGKVESANRFIQWLEPWQGELENEKELIEKIQELNREINLETSKTTAQPRVVLMQKEKEYLKPITNRLVLESYLTDAQSQKVPTTMLVNYKGRGYSVPKKLIGKTVKLYEADGELQIYYNSLLICTHVLSDQPINYKPEHYREGLESAVKDGNSDVSIEEMTKKNLASLKALGSIKESK